MSLSDVTISHDAWADPRIQFLAQLAKYADGIDTAVAKMARLWARCTFLGTDVVPVVEVNACLGSAQGARLLVDAGLGEETPDGIRVKGRFANGTGKDRLGWHAGAEHRNTNGGRVRAAGAVRGPNGTFLRREGAGPASSSSDPAAGQPNSQQPASNSSVAGPATPASDQDQRSGSEDQRSPCSDQGSVPVDADPDLGGGRDLVPAAPRAVADRLVIEFLSRLDAARRDLAAKYDLGEVRNVPLMGNGGEGERDLRRRLSESSDPEGDLAHVLDIAIAEADKAHELKWLGWSIASEKSWNARLMSSRREAEKPLPPRAGPKPRNPYGYAEPHADYPVSDEPVPFGEKLACK